MVSESVHAGPGTSFHASDRERELFGPEVLDELSRRLFAKDCQTCGRAFGGGEVPALVVDDLEVFVTASLHHVQCRRPTWNDSGAIEMPSVAVLSFATAALLLPVCEDGQRSVWPVLLVNPGVEAVIVVREDSGGWRVGRQDYFLPLGFSPMGKARLDVPLDKTVASARLTGGSVVATVMGDEWGAPVTREMSAEIRRRDGVLVVLSSLLNPKGHVTGRDANEVLTDPRAVSAFIRMKK